MLKGRSTFKTFEALYVKVSNISDYHTDIVSEAKEFLKRTDEVARFNKKCSEGFS